MIELNLYERNKFLISNESISNFLNKMILTEYIKVRLLYIFHYFNLFNLFYNILKEIKFLTKYETSAYSIFYFINLLFERTVLYIKIIKRIF